MRCDRDISLQGKIRFLWPSVPPPGTGLPGSGLAALLGARQMLVRGEGCTERGGHGLALHRPVPKDGGGDAGRANGLQETSAVNCCSGTLLQLPPPGALGILSPRCPHTALPPPELLSRGAAPRLSPSC